MRVISGGDIDTPTTVKPLSFTPFSQADYNTHGTYIAIYILTFLLL
jgi:hypothetical protein